MHNDPIADTSYRRFSGSASTPYVMANFDDSSQIGMTAIEHTNTSCAQSGAPKALGSILSHFLPASSFSLNWLSTSSLTSQLHYKKDLRSPPVRHKQPHVSGGMYKRS